MLTSIQEYLLRHDLRVYARDLTICSSCNWLWYLCRAESSRRYHGSAGWELRECGNDGTTVRLRCAVWPACYLEFAPAV